LIRTSGNIMSRLADLLTNSVAPGNANPGLLNAAANFSASRAAAAGIDFQALFAQELALQQGPEGGLPTSALQGAPGEQKQDGERGETKSFEAAAPNAAELLNWLPLAVTPAQTASPAAPQGAEAPAAGATALARSTTSALAVKAEHVASQGNAPLAGVTGAATELTPELSAGRRALSAHTAGTQELAAAPAHATAPAANAFDLKLAQALPNTSAKDPQPLHVAPSLAGAPAAAGTLTAAAPSAVQAPFGAAAWSEEFTQQVVLISKQELSTAQLRLNPPQLGPIEVSVTIRNDQAEASFAAASAPVREAIEASIPRLREMFAEAGITLGNAFVSQDLGQTRQAFSQDQGGGDTGESRGQDKAAQPAGEVVSVQRRQRLGLVDTFA
jgi:flagellar hook-length control protein FliK